MNREEARKAGRLLVRPLVILAGRAGLGPSTVTVIGLLTTAGASYLAWAGEWLASAAVLALGSVLDAVDGEMARRQNRVSRAGAVLDSACDRIGETLILGAILAGSVVERPSLAYLVPAALGGSLMVSYVRARAEGEGLSCSVGLLTRTERLVLLVAGLAAAAVWGSGALVWTLAALSVGAWATTGQRLARVLRQGRCDPPGEGGSGSRPDE